MKANKKIEMKIWKLSTKVGNLYLTQSFQSEDGAKYALLYSANDKMFGSYRTLAEMEEALDERMKYEEKMERWAEEDAEQERLSAKYGREDV